MLTDPSHLIFFFVNNGFQPWGKYIEDAFKQLGSTSACWPYKIFFFYIDLQVLKVFYNFLQRVVFYGKFGELPFNGDSSPLCHFKDKKYIVVVVVLVKKM